MQRRDGYGSLAPRGAAETLLARRIAVMFGLTILLVGGTLAVRQRALRRAAALRQLLTVGSAQEVQPDSESPRPGRKFVAVPVQVAPTPAAGGAVRLEEVRLCSPDGRQAYAPHSGVKLERMFEPVEEVGAEPAQRALLLFEVPDSFRRGKVFYWGDEVGEIEVEGG